MRSAVRRVAHCRLPMARARSMRWSSSKTDFGFRDVDKEEKERMVRDIFSSVASKYDIMNDFMSLGVHRLWKDEFVSMMGIRAAANADPTYIPRHLDVAGGTGDIAFRSAQTLVSSKLFPLLRDGIDNGSFDALEKKPIVVCDINPDMLHVGRNRAPGVLGEKNAKLVDFVEGNAEKLPFPDESFDIYTIAFGLRNVTNKDVAIREAFRVLKPGGRMMVLEFSHVTQPLVRSIYDQFSFHVIPQLGDLVARDRASYQYLVESIRRFPKQDDLLAMIQQAGFQCCNYVNFSFGMVAVHSGFKLKR